jgi:hypothetical protein
MKAQSTGLVHTIRLYFIQIIGFPVLQARNLVFLQVETLTYPTHSLDADCCS